MVHVSRGARRIGKFIFGSCVTASVVCMLSACGGGGSAAGKSQSVNYTLSASVVSKQGETIPITLTMANMGGTTANIETAQLGPDIIVYKDNARVWDSYSGIVAFRMTLSLEPGGSQNFVVNWNQKDSSGNLVAPGNYIIKASDSYDDKQITISIQ